MKISGGTWKELRLKWLEARSGSHERQSWGSWKVKEREEDGRVKALVQICLPPHLCTAVGRVRVTKVKWKELIKNMNDQEIQGRRACHFRGSWRERCLPFWGVRAWLRREIEELKLQKEVQQEKDQQAKREIEEQRIEMARLQREATRERREAKSSTWSEVSPEGAAEDLDHLAHWRVCGQLQRMVVDIHLKKLEYQMGNHLTLSCKSFRSPQRKVRDYISTWSGYIMEYIIKIGLCNSSRNWIKEISRGRKRRN